MGKKESDAMGEKKDGAQRKRGQEKSGGSDRAAAHGTAQNGKN